jgi:transposase
VHLVLDNASSHKTPAVRRWLAQHPRFVLHFTPTSSSWINLVERWFGELTTKLLRRGQHRSVRQLNTEIRQWIDDCNENPRPYVWTKTAEQILDSIKRYCERINQARHWSIVATGESVEFVRTQERDPDFLHSKLEVQATTSIAPPASWFSLTAPQACSPRSRSSGLHAASAVTLQPSQSAYSPGCGCLRSSR